MQCLSVCLAREKEKRIAHRAIHTVKDACVYQSDPATRKRNKLRLYIKENMPHLIDHSHLFDCERTNVASPAQFIRGAWKSTVSSTVAIAISLRH
ncbi:hypothetical protein P5V15_013561 [Pogonomyrmex californicus]